MNFLDDLCCPVCLKGFKTKKGCASHLRTARSCAWYRRGKLAELAPLDLDGEGGHMQIGEEDNQEGGPDHTFGHDEEGIGFDAEDIMDEIEENDNFFDFVPIPIPLPPQIGEAGPGPSTIAARHFRHRILDDDDDDRVEDVFQGAGNVIRMNQHLHEKWRKLFGQDSDADADGDVPMHHDGDNTGAFAFHPFASELDWRVANWVVKESPGNNSFDRFLSIPGVCLHFGVFVFRLT